jgi:hypothetical protein
VKGERTGGEPFIQMKIQFKKSRMKLFGFRKDLKNGKKKGSLESQDSNNNGS